MEIEFDPAKNAKNIRERGVSFERARDFDMDTAQTKLVQRSGEIRFLATGYLDLRLHMLCFTYRARKMRVISLRKANKREVKIYEASRRNLEQRP